MDKILFCPLNLTRGPGHARKPSRGLIVSAFPLPACLDYRMGRRWRSEGASDMQAGGIWPLRRETGCKRLLHMLCGFREGSLFVGEVTPTETRRKLRGHHCSPRDIPSGLRGFAREPSVSGWRLELEF